MPRLVVAAVAALFLLLACGEAPDTRTNPDGQWEFVSGTGPDGEIENVEGYRTTLALLDGEADGIAGCNAYGADSARITGDRISFGELMGTLVGCGNEVVAFEDAYSGALMNITNVKRTGDRLVLTGPSSELVYTEIDLVTPDELVGRTWTLKAFADADGLHDAVGEATLRFRDTGAFEGTTGCRPFSYGLGTSGGMPSSDLDECAEEAEQEAAMAQVFGAMGTLEEIDGDRLTFSAQGGTKLVYESD